MQEEIIEEYKAIELEPIMLSIFFIPKYCQ